jgi:sortase A
VDYLRKFLVDLWPSLRQRFPLIMIILGVVLLAYVGWEYGSMYFEQRRLAREFERQQQEQQQQASNSAPAPINTDDALTRLSVPKINLESVVVEGTNHRALLLGPGHLEDTPAPGESGNSVISGHRDTFFRHLNDLQMGDEVLVERGGKTFHYQVTGKRVVEPTDLSVIAPTKDPEMTLITCYPTYYIGPAPKRLVVFSKLVTDAPQTAAAAAASR